MRRPASQPKLASGLQDQSSIPLQRQSERAVLVSDSAAPEA
jgi:hypothetical protein